MRETLRTDERDTSLREVTGWDSPAYNHLLFFTNKLEKELAAERERADRNQEDAERWRAAKQMFEAGYEMEDGEPAIALFLPEHLDPNAAIDAARRK